MKAESKRLMKGSMDKITGLADIVVPGHDDWFLNPTTSI
jgi:hypothetical protein